MPHLDDSTLLTILNNYEGEARNSLSNRVDDDTEVDARYNAEPYGDEIAGRSQVVSEDVKDVVESDMPALIRSLLNSGPINKFMPTNPKDEGDVKEAKEKTEFVDWVIKGQPNSYKINYDFIKSNEMYKHGVLKTVYTEEENFQTVEFENIEPDSALELIEILESIPYYDSHETIKEDYNKEGLLDYEFKVKTKVEKIELLPVPNGTFLISDGASSIDDAALTGDISTKTRGQLMAEGYEMELVKKLPRSNGNSEAGTMRQYRFQDDGLPYPGDYGEWANESVEVVDMYPLIDYNMDGIAERRHIIKSGQFILLNEEFDRNPYASSSALMTPYNAIGNGRASQVLNIARVKTSLERGLLDNTYIHNNPDTHINESVNRDDMTSEKIGKVVRHKKDTPPQNNVFSSAITYVGDKALVAIQYQDQKKSKLIGNQLTSQGLNADDVAKETATRFKGVEKAEAAKLELVVRNIAEIGYKKAAQDIIWFAQKFFSAGVKINYQGKVLDIDPTKWKFDHDVGVEVGLGSGNNEQTVSNLTALYKIHTQLKAEQSPLTDESKRYNVLSDLTRALEFTNVSRYFNDPSQPEEVLLAENEMLNKTVIQMQEQLQVMQQQIQNPLVEAETVKAKKDLMESQAQLELDVAKFQESKRQFDINAAQKANKQDEDSAIELTKLELQHNADINGAIQ